MHSVYTHHLVLYIRNNNNNNDVTRHEKVIIHIMISICFSVYYSKSVSFKEFLHI